MSVDEAVDLGAAREGVVSDVGGKVSEAEAAKSERQRSSIGFPYNSLQDVAEFAEKLHANAGTAECSDAQLAAWLKMSPKSSTFRVRVAAARMFGLIAQGATDDHVLTDLGRRFIDPSRSAAARVEAFLNVPLYRQVFSHYEGGLVPPAAALERQIAAFGVAEKQKGRARAALEKSAEFAGFFEHGANRLVKPGLGPTAQPKNPQENQPSPKSNGSGGGGDGFDHDPMIIGLFKRLPKPQDSWTLKERQRWLRTAAEVFDLIYGDEDDGKIEVGIRSIVESAP
jgi:hypothetical protein